jgi:hypothetical protein
VARPHDAKSAHLTGPLERGAVIFVRLALNLGGLEGDVTDRPDRCTTVTFQAGSTRHPCRPPNEWAEGANLCPNPPESVGNGGNRLTVTCAAVAPKFPLFMRVRGEAERFERRLWIR